jgi:hypothetical protein
MRRWLLAVLVPTAMSAAAAPADAKSMNQEFITLAIQQVMPAAVATGLFVSLFTAQEPVPTQDANGAILFDYVNVTSVAGLINIPCMDAPESTASVTANEARAVAEIVSTGVRHVLLSAWYPALYAGWCGLAGDNKGAWIALVDGTQYEIDGVESDSQSQMTRVRLKVASI